MTPITNRAMLVRVSISTWSASKHDKSVTQEVAEKHGVAQGRGRYTKALVEKSALDHVRKMASDFRAWHYKQTLPWDDENYRVLPSANFFAYDQGARQRKAEVRAAMDAFIAAYPRYRDDAKIALNGLFNADDYPSPEEIGKNFEVDVKIKPIPEAGDFRVEIDQESVATIRAEIERSTRDAIANSMRDAWMRLHDAVAHMAERLSAYGTDKNGKVVGAFRDTLVENLIELVDLLPRLNLTNDKALEDMVMRVRQSLTVTDANTLRESPVVRKKTAKAAQEILDLMKEFVA